MFVFGFAGKYCPVVETHAFKVADPNRSTAAGMASNFHFSVEGGE
jgi:hypothetical protein